ncbi:MAG TPA: hypothetical protein VFN23_04245, partial [Ktedonobacteraceae bacterium]|nr:hypothetical protein [Ktedonobacteraceae bacterium]
MIKRFFKATRTKQEQTETAQRHDGPPSSRASRQRKKTAVLAMLVLLTILASVLLFFTHGTTKGTKAAGGNQHYTPTPIATLPIMPVRLNTGWVKRWTYPQFLISNGHKAVPLPFITEVEVTSSPSEQGVVYLCPPAYFDASYTATQDSHYLYRSNDAGKTWARLPLPAGVVGCLLKADPVMAGRIVIKDPVH